MAETLSNQSDVFSYGIVANKIVSYKSVYIFTNKFFSVCLVFMYVLTGLVVISFKQVMEIIWESA